jgi:hypothetical protein
MYACRTRQMCVDRESCNSGEELKSKLVRSVSVMKQQQNRQTTAGQRSQPRDAGSHGHRSFLPLTIARRRHAFMRRLPTR